MTFVRISFGASSSRRLKLSVIAVLLAVFMMLATVPLAQAFPDAQTVEWNKTYSGVRANSVIQTADGGYAIVGNSESTSSGGVIAATPFFSNTANQVAMLVKTDSAGRVEWEKSYGTAVLGNESKSFVSAVQTMDLGYLLFSRNGYLIKTDADGNVQWSRELGLDASATRTVSVQAGIQTSDGNYVLVGNTMEINSENVAWLIKTNDQGDRVWNKTFTGGFNVRAVIETNDRGCAIAGSWRNDFWFAKLDPNSNLQWSQTYAYGEPSDTHYALSIERTSDGGYVLAGTGMWQANGGYIPWLIKINSQGHEQWSLPYGHIPFEGYKSVVQTDDAGYMIALSNSAVLFRTDSSGSDQWTMTYADVNNTGPIFFSGSFYSTATMIRTSDRGYAVIGTAVGGTAWLTKISPEPDVTPPTVSILDPQSKTYETGEIPLNLAVNEQAAWVGYSLDGQDNVTITANGTLPMLSSGAHNVTVYAEDAAGNIGASKMVCFTVVERFPVEWIVVGVVVVVVVVFGLLFRFRKQALESRFRKQTLTAIVDNNIFRTLLITSLCIMLVFVQIFFPCFYFSNASRNSSGNFEVGISYVYERDDVEQIYNEVSRIHSLGINIIRVNMICDPTELNDYLNSKTDIFFTATQQLNMRVAVIIGNNEATDEIEYYLNRWGNHLAYVQILNEPESASSWDIGALFTDDEAISKFEHVYSIVKENQLPTQLYTNFGAGFIVRSNLPIQFSEKLNFVGYDVFMESLLTLSPNFIELLHKITNKDVVITEFGMSAIDDTAQSDYIIRGLNLFKNMGLKGCWLVYWNSVENCYGIRGRLTEQTVGEWIAQNT